MSAACRRRIERDLHDGTQQRLVSLGLELRLAQGMVPAGLGELEAEIGKVAVELEVPALGRLTAACICRSATTAWVAPRSAALPAKGR